MSEEIEEELVTVNSNSGSHYGGGNYVGDDQEVIEEEIPEEEPQPEETKTEEEESSTSITLAGLMEHGKWFVGLAGVSSAGVGVGVLEAKRRAAMKIIDKLNQ